MKSVYSSLILMKLFITSIIISNYIIVNLNNNNLTCTINKSIIFSYIITFLVKFVMSITCDFEPLFLLLSILSMFILYQMEIINKHLKTLDLNDISLTIF